MGGGIPVPPPPYGAGAPFVGGNISGGYGYGYGYVPQRPQQGLAMMPWETRYGPLAPTILNPMSNHYLKLLPTYNAEKNRTTKDHLDAFQNFFDNFYIEHEDVYMRLFVYSFDGDV